MAINLQIGKSYRTKDGRVLICQNRQSNGAYLCKDEDSIPWFYNEDGTVKHITDDDCTFVEEIETN
jgi:hypothetical protein